MYKYVHIHIAERGSVGLELQDYSPELIQYSTIQSTDHSGKPSHAAVYWLYGVATISQLHPYALRFYLIHNNKFLLPTITN